MICSVYSHIRMSFSITLFFFYMYLYFLLSIQYNLVECLSRRAKLIIIFSKIAKNLSQCDFISNLVLPYWVIMWEILSYARSFDYLSSHRACAVLHPCLFSQLWWHSTQHTSTDWVSSNSWQWQGWRLSLLIFKNCP